MRTEWGIPVWERATRKPVRGTGGGLLAGLGGGLVGTLSGWTGADGAGAAGEAVGAETGEVAVGGGWLGSDILLR